MRQKESSFLNNSTTTIMKIWILLVFRVSFLASLTHGKLIIFVKLCSVSIFKQNNHVVFLIREVIIIFL